MQRFSEYSEAAVNDGAKNHAVDSGKVPWKEIHELPRSSPMTDDEWRDDKQ
jgi:hypothetical protein